MHKLSIAILALLLSQAGSAQEIDYQKTADRAEWTWNDFEGTVYHSIERNTGDYDIQLSKPATGHAFVISILKEGKSIYSWKGHRHSVFRINDDILYYPDFHFSSSGCNIVAFDLKKQKALWRVPVVGLGGVAHSAYMNVVAINADDDVVSIQGHESYGDYLEFKSGVDGKTIGHKIFRKGFR